ARHLNTFPTRRSSDLEAGHGRDVPDCLRRTAADGRQEAAQRAHEPHAERDGAGPRSVARAAKAESNHASWTSAVALSVWLVRSRSEEHTSELQSPYDL